MGRHVLLLERAGCLDILLDHFRGFARAARTWSEIGELVGDARKTIGEVDAPPCCRIAEQLERLGGEEGGAAAPHAVSMM